MTIDNKETFISMLEKAYWIETEMVQVSIWEARIESDPELNEKLEKFAIHSENHVNVFNKYLEMLNISEPEERPPGLPEEDIDFKQLDGTQMHLDILKYLKLAKSVYLSILNTEPEILDQIFAPESMNTFVQDIENIIKDKEMHIGICEEKIGGYKLIKSASSGNTA